MKSREEYIFWKLAHSFIADYGYRIIQLFENHQELWLEKLENKAVPIIRLRLQDLDWSNVLQRDIEFTAANGERVRQQLNRRELPILNLYISEYPPVDEYEFRIEHPYVHPQGNKTTVRTILLAQGLIDQGFQFLSEAMQHPTQFPIAAEYTEYDVQTLKAETLSLAMNKEKADRAILFNSKPFFTYVLIAIQVAVFVLMEISGGSTNTSTLIKFGAKVNQLIYDGEWWRFFTPIFLHIGFLHLLFNTMALYYLGITVERIFGKLRFLFIYLFAGVIGFIASFIFSTNLSAGASGAIYGCFGALLYFGMIYPKLFSRTMGMNLLVVLGINLIFSFTAPSIDNAGHLGGLAGGFLAAGIVHFPKRKKWLLQMLFLIISVAITWGALSYGYSPAVKSQDETSALMMAQEYLKQKNYDAAYRTLKDFEKSADQPTDKTYFLLSYAEIKKGLLPDAKLHLQKAINLNPKFHEAYYNLALINLEQNDIEAAKMNAEKAAKLKPDRNDYKNLVREINQHLQSSDAGE
ncbi:rhomboid family intramembrane serine protease [Neobacillus sp. YIM B02564]|uniref:Rhomboid family intramembrane serine protease n=1 Tax=Neobacillus paridis TaxID=2803862 RepID=A0ABS1TJB9_9BACI|nr:rhomboid family intramembrane serine protease [Neobacillus paridis]MBL4951406.1 rhomboid family intramembrane serine protease [Neobacillus paridis]